MYQAGRSNHGWQVRAEPRARLKTPPQASPDKLLFDTIVHGQPAVEFLVSSCKAERVLLGSDYPFDMGTLECVRQVEALSSAGNRQGNNPRRCGDEIARSYLGRSRSIDLLRAEETTRVGPGTLSTRVLTACNPRLL